MVVVVSGFTACWSGVSAVRGRSSSHEARHWCREFCPGVSKQRSELLAGDAQQLAASTACIGSEVACLRGHKKCRKSCLLACCKDTSKNLYASPPALGRGSAH